MVRALLILALSSSFVFSQNKIDMEKVYTSVAMYDQVFLNAGIDIEDGKEFDIIYLAEEMFALEQAGLDVTIPFKAAGMDSAKTMMALNNFYVAIKLMEIGLDWKESLSMLDHVKAQGLELTALPLNVRLATALQCGLKEGGQEVDIEKIQKAIELARALIKANVLPNSAYKALGMDIDAIPVHDAKYQALLAKVKQGAIPWAQLRSLGR